MLDGDHSRPKALKIERAEDHQFRAFGIYRQVVDLFQAMLIQQVVERDGIHFIACRSRTLPAEGIRVPVGINGGKRTLSAITEEHPVASSIRHAATIEDTLPVLHQLGVPAARRLDENAAPSI